MIPVTQNLYCYKGQTYQQHFYFKDTKKAPIDLSGLTAKAQIRPAENSETLTAELHAVVFGPEGKISLGLNDAETAALLPGVYMWDLKVSGDDRVRYWLRGKFIVSGRVTE